LISHPNAGYCTRACFCGFCSLQCGAPFGDHELPWLNWVHVALLDSIRTELIDPKGEEK